MASQQNNRTTEVVLVNAVLFSLSTLAVSLRLISRWMSAAKLWWDDACIVLAWICLVGSTTLTFEAASKGVGKHVEEVTARRLVAQNKIIYGSEVLYGPHITAIKTSILLLYLRLFGVRKDFRLFIFAVQIFVILWCVANLFASIFQTNPISGIWYSQKPQTHVNYTKYLVGLAVPNVLADFVILVMPISMVWQLQISRSRKAGLCSVFMLGTFVCAVSIIRTHSVAKVNKADASYAFADTLLWSSTEVNVGIICACLPVIRPTIQRTFKSMRGLSHQFRSNVSSSGKHTTQHSESETRRAKAPFRRLDENVVALPPKVSVSNAWISGGIDPCDGDEINRPKTIPLNAIYVQKHVNLT